MQISVGDFVPVFASSDEDMYWIFRLSGIKKRVLKGRYMNRVGPLRYSIGLADTIKPKNIIRFNDDAYRRFSLELQDGLINLPVEFHEELTDYVLLLQSFA